MAVQRFYGPVNGETKRAIRIYGATHTLTACSGSTQSGGAGNITAFSGSTFFTRLSTPGSSTVWAPDGVIEGDKQLVSIAVKLMDLLGAKWYVAILRFADGSEESIQMYDNGTLTDHLTDTELYSWGIVVVPASQGVANWDYINLTPTYTQYHTKEVLKIYGSVNGATKLCYQKMLGKVVYYTDSGNTQTAEAELYSDSDVNQLCHSGDSWSATIDGVTIANTKIKEVQLYSGVTQINLGFCYGCTELTDVTLPNTVTYIGQHFLDNCHKFNSPLNISHVEFIGGYFMHECDDFNQPLYIPSTVQTIGDYFMYRCNSLVQPITVDCPASVITYDDHSLSTLVTSVPGYRTGHTLNGTYAQEWKTKFANRTLVPYRKLFVDTENEWGELFYYSGVSTYYDVTTTDSTVTINAVDTDKLATYITDNDINVEVDITISKSIFTRRWTFTKMDGTTTNVTYANLESTTGIDASVSGTSGTATASFQEVSEPDPTSSVISIKLTNENEFITLFGGRDVITQQIRPAEPRINGVDIDYRAVQGYRFGGLENFNSSMTTGLGSFLCRCENLEWVNMVAYNKEVISAYFLRMCDSLVDFTGIPDSVIYIGEYFMTQCTSFNQLVVIPDSVTDIGEHFMSECSSFNQPITLPVALRHTPYYFLSECTSFNQEVLLPEGFNSIFAGFLQGCTSFNQPLTIPDSVTSIEGSFLYNCRAFNQPITFPSGITSIGASFLSGCTSFNQPITIPTTITAIPGDFLRNTAFNQSLTIPSNITSIGIYFLGGCTSFNKSLTVPGTVSTIGGYFLGGCTHLTQPVTISSGVTSIGINFLSGCTAFNQPITIPSTVTKISNYFLSTCTSFNNTISLPNTITEIGMHFLYGDSAYDTDFTIPSSVTTIGLGFMYRCTAFNKPITIPSTVTSIGSSFMYYVNDMQSIITCNTPSSVFTSTSQVLCVAASSTAYTNGIKLSGTYATDWHNALPDSSSIPYRKTIVV